MEYLDTFPKLLLSRYQDNPTRIIMRKKNLGIWLEYTWEDCYTNIKALSLGLISLGIQRQDKVCICGDNDPQWYWAELAVQAAGAIAIGIFADSAPAEMVYIAQHSEARFIFAKDQEQCDKLMEVKNELPLLRNIIYWDPKGMSDYETTLFKDFGQVQEMGREYEKLYPGLFKNNVEQTKGTDYAVFCYTSATTGNYPKGAMITYDSLSSALDRGALHDSVNSNDDYVSVLPGSWIAEQAFGIGWWLKAGVRVNFPEEPETMLHDIREVGACYLLFGSRQWESMRSMVQVKMNDAGRVKKLIYDLVLPVGYKVAEFKLEKWQNPSLFWKLLYQICNVVMFHQIRDQLGFSKLRIGISTGTLLSADTFHFLRSIGVPIKEAYGSTEALYIASYSPDCVKIGTAGPPLPGAELRIRDDGELLIRSNNPVSGYYKNVEASEKSFKNGWFCSGDAVFIDDDGYLVYQDRVTDMMRLKDGTVYSPTHIENMLKFSPYVKDSIAIGSDRDFVAVIVNMDFDNIAKWAEKSGISFTTFVDLSQKAEVYDLIQKALEKTNERLPHAVRVRRFALLAKELDADEGELTRTRKLRRWFLEEKYQQLIDSIYSGKDKVATEAKVKYRDGREGTTVTAINIRDLH